MVTLILIALAVLIIAYLFLGNVIHFHASFHMAHTRLVLIVALVLIILALVLRR
jgi:hypothetical protein